MASRPHSTVQDCPHELGTPAYRAWHVSMIWSRQLWHEAILILGGCVAAGLAFYMLAPVLAR